MGGLQLLLGYVLAGTLVFLGFMGLLWLLLRLVEAAAARDRLWRHVRFAARNLRRHQALRDVVEAHARADLRSEQPVIAPSRIDTGT